MKMTIPMGLTLLSMSGAASAWQPVVYPIRSQNAWQQNTDAATCYSTASRQSGVNITREAQSPTRPKLASGAASIGGGGQASQPPLPASGAVSASGTKAMAAAGMPPSSGAAATTAQASEPMPKIDGNGVPELAGASEPQTAAEVKAPPMPPPEPPMTRYWRAYATCMQGRGYAVQ